MSQPQVAVVTGGGRGIGRAIAQALAGAGMSVAVVARTDADIQETVSIIRKAGGIADGWAVDVTDAHAMPNAFESITSRWGGIDLLVNNAAIGGPIGPCWESPLDEWWRTIDVNVRGPLVCTHAVLGKMIARRRGRIINVVSSALPIAYFSAYMTSKSALTRFTECLAIEAKPFGVTAFALNPGTVRTAMSERSLNSPEGQQWLPWFRRIFDEGLNVDIARPAARVLALASGQYDALSGLLIGPLDDLDAMRASMTTIDHEKLYSMRVRTLPTTGQAALDAVRRSGEQAR